MNIISNNPVRLTHEEKISPAWKKIRKYVESELAMARTALESDLDPVMTAKVRGRIASLNLVAALGEDLAPSTVEEEDPD